MPRRYWLTKSEPAKYSWSKLVADRRTYWDGVRNYEARNHLQAMQKGDLVLFYHSNDGREVVGVAGVVETAYQDPTTKDERWVAVDVEPVVPLKRPVTLAEIKADAKLEGILLVRQSRLSVMPLEARHFRRILSLGKTRLP